VTEFLEKKATTGTSSEEESIVTNVGWTIYGGEPVLRDTGGLNLFEIYLKQPPLIRSAIFESL